MRRFLAVMLCCLLFATTVYADNAASGVQANATVSSDGSCQVSISMNIRLDESVSGLSLPLGSGVSSVRINGSAARTFNSNGITNVRLNSLVRNVTGTVPITVTFTVNSVVTTEQTQGANGESITKQIITVPLLYGFTYPVEQMNFTVTMPGEFDTVPTFLSGYHQQDIESSITSTTSGATITGSVTEALKDHETLVMTLEAPEGMFPQNQAAGGSLVFDAIAMSVCGVLALLYWLMKMSCLPRFPVRRSTAPEGVSAGSVGSYLVHRDADLSMMAISWAQLGYLTIRLDQRGRVYLHKHMEMGNERSAFEGRAFKRLFGKGAVVNATSGRFARLCEQTAAQSRRHGWGLRPRSGNPRILRLLGCGMGLFAGIAIGDSLTTAPAWRVIWMILLGFAGAVSTWQLQEGFQFLQLRGRNEKMTALGCAVGWIIMGFVSGQSYYALAAAGGNALIGLLAACTGRRTENGNLIRDELLGLRRYMSKVTKKELCRILRSNPDYYYELAPYALALGVDKKFALRFGGKHHPRCTWLITPKDPVNVARDFYPLLRQTVDAMNLRRKRSFVQRLLNIR